MAAIFPAGVSHRLGIGFYPKRRKPHSDFDENFPGCILGILQMVYPSEL